MNRLHTILFLLVTAIWTNFPVMIPAQTAAPQLVNPTLYPPQNFSGGLIECSAWLHWQKPQQPGGTTPPGLVGYYLYRDGILRHYCPSGDSLTFYDNNIESPGTYAYTLTASYDLTSYGSPGQFGESPAAGPVSITANCDFILPLYEPWDMGSFTYQNWSFIPTQGNWHMNTAQGNPLPAVDFLGDPGLLNYDFLLRSVTIPMTPWACASISFDVDVKLNDIAAGGTEKLLVQYYLNNQWVTVVELSNNGTTDWVHYSFDISEVALQSCRIGFRAQGQNSQNIGSWLIDNILVQSHCFGPQSCGFVKLGDTIQLSWQPPACDSIQYCFGYNVYRTSGTGGLPPFMKLNPTPVTALGYADVIPSTVSSGIYRYIITALQKNPATGDFLCEAPCDTLYVDYQTGIPGKDRAKVTVFPNPAGEELRISSSEPIQSVRIINSLGKLMIARNNDQSKSISLPVASCPPGIYLVEVSTPAGISRSKVLISR